MDLPPSASPIPNPLREPSSPMHVLLFTFFTLLVSSCHGRDVVSKSSGLSVQAPASPVFPAGEVAGDGRALLSFRSSMSADPLRALSAWNRTLHHCRWPGVTCGGRRHPERVTALDLDSLALAGPLSPALANLTFLRRLHLADNRFDGRIPPELGALSRLQYLNLSLNSLQGEVPTSLGGCSRLLKLSMRNNMLHGAIPANLSRCTSLQILSLSNNELSGSIPPEIGSLPRLVHLYLRTNTLEGPIPPSIGNLSSLTEFFLSGNNLAGPIPNSIWNLSSLTLVDFSENNLVGPIPSSIGSLSSLTQVDLSDNNLAGPIPPSIGSLSSLTIVDFSENHLVGPIPPSIGNLSSLTQLNLAKNNLTGPIPGELCSISTLGILSLSFNRLSGEVPPSLYNLSLLSILELASNQLVGTLPPYFGLSFPRLRQLQMYSNQFGGPIPSSLSNASQLQWIELTGNGFSGRVPSTLGNLRYLSFLTVSYNRLEARGADDWDFVTSLTNCSQLKILELQSNVFAGTLPPSMANLSSTVEVLSIGDNQISGGIPQEIGQLHNLTTFLMHKNLLTGAIPMSVGRLSMLQALDLSGNMLSGEIPSSLGNLTILSVLSLNNNKLKGQVPFSFGNYKYLNALDLSSNALNGHIPVEVFRLTTLSIGLDLSHNSFIGVLPTEVGNLRNLVALDVSGNKLSGEIPASLSQCQVLGYLHMQGNLFHGTIMEPLKGLSGVTELDLSRNNLSGPIPGFLESFPFLQYLNLSFNNFEGEVPRRGIFGKMNASSLVGNDQLCGGDSRLHLQACPTRSPRKGSRWRDNLKIIIPILCVCLLTIFAVVSYFVVYRRLRRKPGSRVPSSASMKDQFPRVSYADLLKATDGFSPANLIGVGSFGSVYKGVMGSDQKAVAVKVLNLQREGASKSFMRECEVLRNIRHHNLVRILTACSSADFQGNDFKALVYEFMPNGNLEQWLHPQCSSEHPNSGRLGFIRRLNIVIDVASALEYLHGHHGQTAIVHCDLKPSNILLDHDMIAHVGDFGISRFLPGRGPEPSQVRSSTIGVKGSIGYIAPEYAMGHPVSTQGDAYSYGILLLEMFTGKKPTDDSLEGATTLHKYVEHHFPEEVMSIIDLHLLSREEDERTSRGARDITSDAGERLLDCLVSVMGVGLSCSKALPRERMEIKDAGKELHLIRDAFLRRT